MRQQRGFTLLELMVAMTIFAALAVSGWQVFDSVNRARERAQLQADNLSVLQYAYLQLQQDMGQVIAYQAPSTQSSSVTNSNNNSANDNNINANLARNEQNTVMPEPFMSLDSEQLSFVRYADPDPRYQTSPSIQRIEYLFSDQRLIRRQYSSVENDSIGLDSVILDGITEGRWQAYLPELTAKFPDSDNQNSNNNALGQASNSIDNPKVVLLPKGISISFTYQEMPITWQFALAAQSPPNNNKAGNNPSNGNGDSNNNGNNTNDDNSANSPVTQ